MIETSRKPSYGGSYKQAGVSRLFLKKLQSQRTCVMTPVQPKVPSKVLEFVPFCANMYAKEMEKNITVFIKYYGELLAIISDYFLIIR